MWSFLHRQQQQILIYKYILDTDTKFCNGFIHVCPLVESFSEEMSETTKGRVNRFDNDDINDNHDQENEYLEYLEGVGSRLASHWYVDNTSMAN